MRRILSRGRDRGEAQEAGPVTWMRRLATIGHTLEARPMIVMDVAVSFASDDGILTGLAWSTGTFNSAWVPFSL